MAVSEKLKSLVDKMPDPDRRDMYCTDIDKERIEKAIAEIHKGGRANILGLIDMLGEPGSDQDAKPHYALHCLANYVLIIKDERARRRFCRTVASQLGGDRSKYVQGFLCQELQWAGGKEATAALGKLLGDEELVEPASMALVAIGDGAAKQFLAALPKAKGKCRLNVVQGLSAVGGTESVGALKQALRDPDREVRLAAGWGLARIGDGGSVEALLNAAEVQPGWERIQATKHCLVLAENLLAAGRRDMAERIYTRLRETRTDPAERYVRDAAKKG
ncbi:MAG: HEAT repeat domain-containing protein, partial [Planctomycetota bacterium]